MNEVFIRILNMSITAGWLILAIIVLRAFLKKAPRKIVCLLWALAAVRLVCPFTLESAMSLLPSSQTIAVEQNNDRISVQTGFAAIDNRANEYLGSHVYVLEQLQEEDLVGGDVIDSAENPGRTGVNSFPAILLRILPYIWLAGVLAMLAYAGITYLSLHKKVVASLEDSKGVFICDDIDTPFILGVIRPRIYLPSILDTEERKYVLAHEKAHIKRGDYLWKPFGYLLLAVYWFHPLIWAAYILLCKDIEIACDEKVIAGESSDYKKAYAHTLLACSVPGKLITVCPLAFGEVGVKERILSVMNYRKPAFWVILVALIGCVIVAICFMTNPVNKSKVETNTDQPGIEVESNTQDAAPLQSSADTDSEDTSTEKRFSLQYGLYRFGTFWIRFNEDGTYKYYETPISSFIGSGNWSLAADFLTMKNDAGAINHFRVGKDTLYFIDEGSANFYYVPLKDGNMFTYDPQDVNDDFTVNVPEVDHKAELEERNRQIDEYLNSATAKRLQGIKTVYGINTSDGNGTGEQWFELRDDYVILNSTKDGREDVVLYGLSGGDAMVLRKGNSLIPLKMYWQSPQMYIPEIYCGDYDKDGRMEYALKTHMGTGTGVCEDELYFIETAWDTEENGFAAFSMLEFTHEKRREALADVGYLYDADTKILTATYQKKKLNLSINLSDFLSNGGEELGFRGAGFGDVCSFEERNGEWFYSVQGGILTDDRSWMQYEYGFDASATVTYSKKMGFGLQDIQLYKHEYNRLYIPRTFEDSEEVIINELKADLDGDGEQELIQVYGSLDTTLGQEPTIDNVLSFNSYGCDVRVIKHRYEEYFGEYDSTLFDTCRNYHPAHAGNGIVFLSRINGKEYLVLADPYIGQGMAHFEYKVIQCGVDGNVLYQPPLYIENGEVEFMIGDEQNPDWNESMPKAADAVKQYREALAPYLEDSVLLLGFHGVPAQGTASTKKKTISAKEYFDSLNLYD